MAEVIADGLEVCVDCTHLIANGEGTAEHAARMVAVWGAETRGLVLACGPDEGETCSTFTASRCDGCGSDLAGERHAAAVLR